jgi:hypothetical protein
MDEMLSRAEARRRWEKMNENYQKVNKLHKIDIKSKK